MSIFINSVLKIMPYKFFLGILISLETIMLLLLLSFNFIIDPFNMNGIFKLGFDKKDISYRTNYRLYKLIAYNSNYTFAEMISEYMDCQNHHSAIMLRS